MRISDWSSDLCSSVLFGARDAAEMRGARLGGAAEGLEIDPHQSEMFRIAAGPLEIVEERPIDVAMHGNAVLHARPHGLERAVNEYDPPRIVVGRDAAFGEIGEAPCRVRVCKFV